MCCTLSRPNDAACSSAGEQRASAARATLVNRLIDQLLRCILENTSGIFPARIPHDYSAGDIGSLRRDAGGLWLPSG